MPPTNPPPTRDTAPRNRPSDALERLYVYWLVSTLLLLFAIVVATVYTRGAQVSQARHYERALGDLAARVAELERDVADLRMNSLLAPRPQPPSSQPAKSPAAPPAEKPKTPTTQPSPQRDESGAARAAAATAPSETEINAALDRCLTTGDATPYVVKDPAAGQALVHTALENLTRAPWAGATWARLALLARLLSQDAPAESFATRAGRLGDPLTAFAEVSARVLLAQGRPQEALVHAEHFAQRTAGGPAARVLLAHVFLALGSPATADELVADLPDVSTLKTADRLALARVYFGLHHWDRLAAIVADVPNVPAELESEYSFLHAVALVQRNERLVEALSVLDYLAEQNQARPSTAPAATSADSPAAPDAYEVTTWRGVALMRGQQIAAARQAFDQAVALRDNRPEAYYWRAMLEVREKQYEAATTFLNKAVAIAANYAPAWETLGWLALEAGDLDGAVKNLEKAVGANERQASTQFLLAIAHARAGQREPAVEALQATFALDASYLQKAEQVDALTRLIPPDEMRALAHPPAASAPADSDSDRR